MQSSFPSSASENADLGHIILRMVLPMGDLNQQTHISIAREIKKDREIERETDRETIRERDNER